MKDYRTAQGKGLNMEQLILQHEHVRAIGNMNVNARGDEVDSKGNIIRTRDEIMKKHNKISEKKSELEVDE